METKQNRVIKSDEEIKEEVLDFLFKDYNVDASHIEVEVNNRVVTLKGYVRHPEEVYVALRGVDHIPLVRKVISELKVVPPKDRPLSQTGFETGFS